MRTRAPCCTVGAAGAGGNVEVLEGEERDVAASPGAAAAAADEAGESARSGTSQFVASTALEAETEGTECDTCAAVVNVRARGLPRATMTAVTTEPSVTADEERAASSCRMAPAGETFRCECIKEMQVPTCAHGRFACLSAPAQASTRRCTCCGAGCRSAASSQQRCHWQAPRQR